MAGWPSPRRRGGRQARAMAMSVAVVMPHPRTRSGEAAEERSIEPEEVDSDGTEDAASGGEERIDGGAEVAHAAAREEA